MHLQQKNNNVTNHVFKKKYIYVRIYNFKQYHNSRISLSFLIHIYAYVKGKRKRREYLRTYG